MKRPIAFLCALVVSFGYADTQATNLESTVSGHVASVATVKTTESLKANVVIPAGIIFGSFTKEDGPYLIEGSVIVPSGQTLEFGPGCQVYIGGDYSTITVFGQIISKGTALDPVLFRSVKTHPNPWDWDRIYIRSRNRSVFEHCIFRHSNYGVVVENGSASIESCEFDRNSLHGLVVRNSEVVLNASTFENGHVTAILCESGANIQADSLIIRENITGIACKDNAILNLRGGTISRNVNGIAVEPGANVTIISTTITKNKNGVIAKTEIPRKTREMVYGNVIDMKTVSKEELDKVTKEPEAVRSIVLPNSQTVVSSKQGGTPGFSALSAPVESMNSFIGNVTTGFTVFAPHSYKHPIKVMAVGTRYESTDSLNENPIYDTTYHDTTVFQTKYPGEQNDKFYAGIQPDIQVFASGRSQGADVNLLADIQGNQWLSTSNYVKKNIFNLSMNYSQQSLVFGDFFESGSETSVSGRRMSGIKFTSNLLEMGAGVKQLEFKLAAGETEIPKDSGFHQLDIYNEKVDTGMSVRQQITYIASSLFRPTRNSTVSIKGIIARDQTNKPLFSDPLSDPYAPPPIESQTGCIDGTVNLLNGALQLNAEIDLGTKDNTDSASMNAIAWYNPQIDKAVPNVFNLINSTDFSEYFAASAGARSNYKGYAMGLIFTEIAPNYFAAGNPYLEADRRKVSLTTEKSFTDNLSASGEYGFERTSVSTVNPVNRNNLSLGGKCAMGEGKPDFALDYTLQTENKSATEQVPGDSVTQKTEEEFRNTTLNNLVSLEGKQNLKNGVSYSLRYQLLWNNDISKHPNVSLMDAGDGMQHQVSGWFSFKVQKLLKNKLSVRLSMKDQNRDSLQGLSYKFNDQLNYTVIPRKLNVIVSGEYSSKANRQYDSDIGAWQKEVNTNFYGGELEVKYSINAKTSINAKGRYEKGIDETVGSSENYDAKIGALHLTYLF